VRHTRLLALILIALLAATAALAQSPDRRPITFEDLISFHRIGDPQISPDGKWVAYVVATPDLEANRTVRNIWLVPLPDGEPRQLTRSGRDSRPRWSPDGKRIAFVSARDGAPQIYIIALEGGEAQKLTSLSTGAADVLWSPDGAHLAFTSQVWPDCADDACNRERSEAIEKSPVQARIYEHLLYRHWDTWKDGRRSHLFVVPAEGGEPRNLTPGASYDVPPFSLGGPEPISFSPDGAELCFTANTDVDEALSTNADLFLVSVNGGPARRITTNLGYDGGPAYSPDGRWIAYHAQFTPGYESDRWRLMLYSREDGRHRNLTQVFDRNVEGPVWSPDSRTIYFQAEHHGQLPVYALSTAGGEPQLVMADSYNAELAIAPDGRIAVVSRPSLSMPAELFVVNLESGEAHPLTRHNAARLAELDLPRPEHFWFPGAGGTRVHAMLLRPPGFDPGKKYPLLVIAHGGPQTMFSDAWSYRWNSQVFAAPGYAVLMINRRGSTGFGQKFVDEIVGDYGGKAFEDLMLGVDYALENYPFLDGERMAAAGASYGGFMMNWFAGHTRSRFRAIVTHASIYDQVSMYGATEELWFMEHDQQGTPWTNPEGYRKWSPGSYAAEFGRYRTPTLVIHGELDFRVPYTQGLQMFTALQRQGVPSKLLIFPDEGHWILKPQNSRLWYRTVMDWLAEWLR
jgi:dipeptidyl aminopeptidase/acylaminoacyl peptidase